MPVTWLILNASAICRPRAQPISRSVPPCRCSIWNRRRICCAPFYLAGHGRPARAPEDMLRSLVLMVMAGVQSFTDWVALMREQPFYAALSGFSPDQVPGVGTFYDFLNRLLSGPPRPLRRPRRRLTPLRKTELRQE